MSETDYPGKGDPWADFLHYRKRLILEFTQNGDTPYDIAITLSMDERQVALILNGILHEMESQQ